jgi:hypothetical protein
MASTDSSLGFHSIASWRGSPPRKLTRGCKVGPTGQEVWLAGHPLGAHVSGLCRWPPHVWYIPEVTLIWVEFLISLQFLEMLQFGTYVPEIK